MAGIHAPSASFMSVFLPVARAALLPGTRPISLLEQIQHRARHVISSNILPAAFLPIPTLLGELWDGLLNAVPKKKTSHMKKRHRQMAGKALQDVTALNRCSSCGRIKRAHILCPYCVTSIRQWLGNGFKSAQEVEAETRRSKEAEESGESVFPTDYEWADKYDEYGRRKSERKRQNEPQSAKALEAAAGQNGREQQQQKQEAGVLTDVAARVATQKEAQDTQR